MKFVFSDSLLGLSLRTKAFRRCLELLARYRLIMLWVLKLEQILYRYGPGPSVLAQNLESIDLLCMIGYSGIELQETNLLWWAKFNNIPVINVVANYDNLSTKGFRGVDIDRQ